MTDAEPHRAGAAFAHRDFRFFQGARFLSVIASQMQSIAVGWMVYELTRRPLELGYVGLAQFLPAVGFSLVTGHVADRFDRRAILVVHNIAMAICSMLLFLLARRGGQEIWPIYAVLFLIGTTRAFAGPASQALLPELVPPEHFSSAVAWSSSIWQLSTITGPAIGGALYAAFHSAPQVYLISALLSLVATCLVAAIATRTGVRHVGKLTLDTLLAGLRYVRARKLILGSISLDLFAVLLGGAVALLPVFARDVLHVGPMGFGLLRSAPAVGAGAMAVSLAYRPLRRHNGAWMFAGVLVFGLATIGFGLSRSFLLSLLCLALIGASDMISVVVRHTLVQLTTPSEMRGRVAAVNLVFIGASNELGEFESGITAQWFGAVGAVVLGGVGTLVVVALWAWRFPQLRKIDRIEAEKPAAP